MTIGPTGDKMSPVGPIVHKGWENLPLTFTTFPIILMSDVRHQLSNSRLTPWQT